MSLGALLLSNYRKYAISIFLLFLVVIHLIAYNVKGKEDLNFLEKGVLMLAYPLNSMVTGVTNKITYLWKGYIFLVSVGKENTRLKIENIQLRSELNKLSEVKQENIRLRELLVFTQDTEDKYIAARVVSTGPSNFFHTLVINKGSEEGIKRGMAVITSMGVVGQISYVKQGYSGVLTLLDPNSAIDAIDQKTRARGILRGYRSRKLIFKYLPFSEVVNAGDKVVSSGMDGIYPKGIIVGNIEKVDNKKDKLFQHAVVKPVVDFSRLEEVLINLEPSGEQGLE